MNRKEKEYLQNYNIAAYVTETEEVESGRRYRSAKQFKRNVETFYEM